MPVMNAKMNAVTLFLPYWLTIDVVRTWQSGMRAQTNTYAWRYEPGMDAIAMHDMARDYVHRLVRARNLVDEKNRAWNRQPASKWDGIDVAVIESAWNGTVALKDLRERHYVCCPDLGAGFPRGLGNADYRTQKFCANLVAALQPYEQATQTATSNGGA